MQIHSSEFRTTNSRELMTACEREATGVIHQIIMGRKKHGMVSPASEERNFTLEPQQDALCNAIMIV
jgi:hypothetical protein